jgi:Pentapeptide repeats (8 copies)
MVEEKPGQKDEGVGREDTLLRKKLVRLTIALGAVLAVALVVSLGFALRWYPSPQTDLSISQRQALVQGLASAGQALAVLLTGAVGLIGLYLTRQNTNKQLRQARESTQEQLQQARESQERTQASAQETLRLTEQGQITERFTRAIEQLGATGDKGYKKLEIRLGGIYALERIAWDSPERDYSTVMEVLTAYVRENTSQAPGPSKGSSDATSTSNEATTEAEKQAQQPAAPESRRPTADVQAILDVLGRAQDRVPEEYRTRLDLHDTFLQGADLLGANLQEANLYGANLKGAKVTDEERAITLSLQDATMPDGRTLKGALTPDGPTFEDWLKSQGRG